MVRTARRLSTPLPIVALPWGSRSISSTRQPAWASAAARLTLVVVLPTPPFWFTTARTSGSAMGAAQHQMAFGVEERRAQRNDAPAVASRRYARELFPGEAALHCRKHAGRGEKMVAGLEEARELGEGARDNDGKQLRRMPFLDASLVHFDVL